MAKGSTATAFVSTSGATIDDVRAHLASCGWTIERDKAYKCRRWIMRDGGKEPRRVRYNPTMGEMLEELGKLGVAGFVAKYETATDGKTHKARRECKMARRTAAAAKRVKRENAPKVAELQERRVQLVLERMRLGISAADKKRVRDELAMVRDEIVSLGGDLTIGSQVARDGMTRDDIEEAMKRGEERRRESRRRKEAVKAVANGKSGGAIKRGRKRADDAESYDDLVGAEE